MIGRVTEPFEPPLVDAAVGVALVLPHAWLVEHVRPECVVVRHENGISIVARVVTLVGTEPSVGIDPWLVAEKAADAALHHRLGVENILWCED